MSRVWIPMHDEVLLSGKIYMPAESETISAAIMVHGFTGDKEESGRLFVDLGDTLRSHGVATLAYNQRGCGTGGDSASEGNYADTSLRQHVVEYMAVRRWFSENLRVPEDHIGAIGFSLGAYIVMSAVQKGSPHPWVALIAPALRPRLDMWPRYKNLALQVDDGGYVFKEDTRILLGRPCLESLDIDDLGAGVLNTSFPVFVVHGTSDTRINIGGTRKAMFHASSLVRYVEIENASHSFRNDADRRQLLEAMELWLAGVVMVPQSLKNP